MESAFVARDAGLRGKRVFLFAGIARPASFEAIVRGLGAEVAGARWFRDHRAFSVADLAALQREAALHSASALVTTEKDQVRLPAGPGALPIVSLPVELRLLAGDDALERALAKVL